MQQMSLREYIDSLEREGYTVRDDHGDDPSVDPARWEGGRDVAGELPV